MPDFQESNRKITLTLGALIWIIMATAAIASVYWRFVVLEHEQSEIEEHIHYVNERLDRKAERIMELVKELENRIDVLEQPNSDER